MLKEMKAKALIEGEFYDVRSIIIQNGIIANLEVWHYNNQMFELVSPIKCDDIIFWIGEKTIDGKDVFEHDILQVEEMIYEVMPINTYCENWSFKGLCVTDMKSGYMVAIDDSLLKGKIIGNTLISK